MQLHDFAGEIFVQAPLSVLPGAGIRTERLLVVEKNQTRRMLLARLEHVAETSEHMGPNRLALERAGPHPRLPCWRHLFAAAGIAGRGLARSLTRRVNWRRRLQRLLTQKGQRSF